MFERARAWISRKAKQLRAWVIGLLTALGLIAVPLVLAAVASVSWTNPVQNTDGSAYNAATEQLEVRLYCDVDPASFVPESPGNPQALTPDEIVSGDATGTTFSKSPAGTYDCFATAVSIYGYESDPSNVAAVTFIPTVPPNAITDFGSQ